MSMTTDLEHGPQVHIAGRQARISEFGTPHPAYVSLNFGNILQGEFGLHLSPAEAIRIADCLICMAKQAIQPEHEPVQEAA